MDSYIKADSSYTKTLSYECAAWYCNVKAVAGQYEIKPGRDSFHAPFVADLDGEIVDDFFPSLFCGNLIGKPYDTTQNAGKPQRFQFVWTGLSLLRDANAVLSPELRAAAIAHARQSNDFYLAYHAERPDDAYHQRELAKAQDVKRHLDALCEPVAT